MYSSSPANLSFLLPLFSAGLILVGSFQLLEPAQASELETGSSANSKPLEITTETEDINITYDSGLAQEQVKKFPDDPEAHFVLAVALTRSSKLEEAFKEIRIARRLAQARGGPDYFNGMIQEYEKILTYYPEDNRIRYHLAWAYYMKAYLLAEYSKRVMVAEQAQIAAQSPDTNKSKESDEKEKKTPPQPRTKEWHKEWVASVIEKPEAEGANGPGKDLSQQQKSEKTAESTETPSNKSVDNLEKAKRKKPSSSTATSSSPVKDLTAMEQVMRKAAPSAVPHIKKYYQSALSNLDELLVREPGDVWARLYRAHLRAEYTGDLDAAMNTWQKVQREHPTNPAAYFFLGEGYLKKGNLRECLTNVSKAIALRAVGN